MAGAFFDFGAVLDDAAVVGRENADEVALLLIPVGQDVLGLGGAGVLLVVFEEPLDGGEVRTASLFKDMDVESVGLEDAVRLLSLPRSLGTDPGTGEEITALGAKPTLGIGELVGTHHATVDEIMQELLVYERRALELYERLRVTVEGVDVSLEEYARTMIRSETLHIAEVEKMSRKRGDA